MLENVVAYMERIVFQKFNVIRNTVQLWFKKDDITISNIYKIAEGYGWEVNITFKLKPQGE